MKKISLLGFAFLFYLGAICQDIKIDKIEALIDILSTEERMSSMITNLIEESLKTADSFDSIFWDEYKVRAINSYNDTLKPQIITIYDKYFTDVEIDYMYEFYSSEIGKQTLKKYDMLLQELMIMGLKFGEQISDQIIQNIEQKEEEEIDFKMNNVFEGCSKFKTGRFNVVINDTIILNYERDEKRQIETYGQGRAVYEINWVNDCRYTLTLLETNNPYDQNFIGATTIVNIYESNKNSYKYYYKRVNSEEIYEGEMTKIE